MTNDNIIKAAISHIVDGRDSPIFRGIKKDIDDFFKRYEVVEWLTSSQSATIHEILMLDDKKKIIQQMGEYKKRQLSRDSEKNKWQKKFNDETAINYFYEMIHGLLVKYDPPINKEMEEPEYDIQRGINYDSIIYRTLIRTFDYIFITQFKISKEGKKDV